MTASSVPLRRWRTYGTGPLPTPQEALGEPFAAFPSWFLRIECERCGKERMLNEPHVSDAQRCRLADHWHHWCWTARSTGRHSRPISNVCWSPNF
jgi:hypothetical protein